MTSALAAATLPQLERIVERGMPAFIEVGNALREIRDRELYQGAGYNTWSAYLAGRWGVSRSYAHRTIEAARLAGLLPIGNVPANEATLRALVVADITDDDRRAAWDAAAELAEQEGERVQEKHVRFVLEHVYDIDPPSARPALCPVCRTAMVCPKCGGIG